ncbi:hypothetical protein NA56DRAFT_54477 [Hyaloscypha hepaticicola]|uniref:Uncharacterized protein n=1 Tax=Hyaloscypha hepaticicola TaxID=2082293 RepID=A0A2J6QCB4_9HELO|nr:hypothetical protein NA56DRAFT_54477 [Hyaloscypha hepaticicola]
MWWYDIRIRTHGSPGKGQSTHNHQIASLPVLGAAQRRKLFSRMQSASRRYRGELQDGVQLRNSDPLFKSGWSTFRAASLHVSPDSEREELEQPSRLPVSNGDGMPRGRCQGPYGAALVWPRVGPGILATPDLTAFVHASHPYHTVPYHTIPHDLTSNDLPIAFHNNLFSTYCRDEEVERRGAP